MPHRAQQIALQEYVHAVQEQLERVQRLTQQIQGLIPQWQLAPMVEVLQALRGVSLVIAATTVAELGDLTRFESAKQLMAYLGLVPSEHSSGGTTRRGGITKTGNGHVRRVLTEAAHAYHHPARESRVLLARLDGLPQESKSPLTPVQTSSPRHQNSPHRPYHNCRAYLCRIRSRTPSVRQSPPGAQWPFYNRKLLFWPWRQNNTGCTSHPEKPNDRWSICRVQAHRHPDRNGHGEKPDFPFWRRRDPGSDRAAPVGRGQQAGA
ncbi:MAG: IS110 family transposase [Anaerolineaceae bacterium]|nr:IS110 family transposase [Anaerolineaceae bacterium]